MKKVLMIGLVAVGVAALAGCQSSKTSYDDEVYSGLYPCANCSAIESTVSFNKDGSYIEQLTYQGTRDGDQVSFDAGSWVKEDNKLRLVSTQTQDQVTYFALSADKKIVTLLDQQGNPIETELNYTLNRVLPSKKMGEYRYLADAATFTECETGRAYATGGIALEKAYGKTGVEGGTPVYAEIEGYYTVRPSMEDGLYDAAFVQTGKITFDKTKSCAVSE